MRVENFPNSTRVDSRHEMSPPHGPCPGRTAQAAGITEGTAHTPAPELVQLAAQLAQAHEIRPELVAQARERLAAGVYLTPAAAELTAQKLIG